MAVAALVAMPRSALGADEQSLLDLDIEQLAELRVTSVSRVQERLGDAPAAVFVITGDEIRRSGVTSIAEALRLAPGVEVARRDAHSWSISIRGFNSDLANNLLVLIDGRSVYSPLYAGVFWDVQDTPLEDVDRIEVVSGPGGTLWGANAVNGVINIITRRAGTDDGGFVEVGGGNQENEVAARYGGTLGENVAARAYAKYFDRDSLKTVSGADGVDESRMAQVGFRLNWSSRAADRFTVQGDAYHGDEAGVFQDDFTLGTLPSGSKVGSTDVAGANVLARWERTLDSGADLSLQTYYDYTRRDIPHTYAERRDTLDIDFQHHVPLGARNAMLWGASLRRSADEIGNTLFATFDPDHRDDETASAFFEDKLEVKRDRMFVTLGAKFEHNDYTGYETQPNVRFSWSIDERRAFWSAVSRAVRVPSRLDADLRLTVPLSAPMLPFPVYVTADGSHEFDSSQLTAYEAGYRFRPAENLSFDIAVYRNDYDRLQTVEPLDPLFVLVPPRPYIVLPNVIANLMEGRARGGTLVANWQPRDRWRLRFEYARLNLDLHLKPGSRDTSRSREAGNSPANQASITSFVDLPGRLQLYTMARYVDALPNLSVDSYVAVDASLRWAPLDRLSASLTVENLNDSRHLEFGAANEIGRSALLRFIWTF
jgi:iron complex outermembrane receptor protein